MRILLITFICLIISLKTNAQTTSDLYFINNYTVIKCDSAKSNEIRRAIKEWISNGFRNARNVIEIDEESKISVKGMDKFSHQYNYGPHIQTFQGYIHFRIDFEIKDEKFRYKIDNIIIELGKDRIPYSDYEGYVQAANTETSKKWFIAKSARENEVRARSETIQIIRQKLTTLNKLVELIPSIIHKSRDDW